MVPSIAINTVARALRSFVDAGSRDKLTELVRANFNLTPKGIIKTLQLRRPIF